jgi:hypothetical protein
VRDEDMKEVIPQISMGVFMLFSHENYFILLCEGKVAHQNEKEEQSLENESV